MTPKVITIFIGTPFILRGAVQEAKHFLSIQFPLFQCYRQVSYGFQSLMTVLPSTFPHNGDDMCLLFRHLHYLIPSHPSKNYFQTDTTHPHIGFAHISKDPHSLIYYSRTLPREEAERAVMAHTINDMALVHAPGGLNQIAVPSLSKGEVSCPALATHNVHTAAK